MMNSDVFVPVYKHGKSNSTSSLDLSVRSPILLTVYPLQWYATRICAYSLRDRPNEEYEDDVIEDEKDDCRNIAPGVDIDHE